MKTTGYKLVELLRKAADEYDNPKNAHLMIWGADEIENLLDEARILSKEAKTLMSVLNKSREEAMEFRNSLTRHEWSPPLNFSWENNQRCHGDSR